ncbi:Uncharacterized protein YjaZ [Mesobacillus persicus]|uniref:Uncharacterized protein YjaZ n=1 Tax=Mesobacillus persicus TaxID=930146 RepID=A0A1H8E886_9BACI|nr:DUF2268 domain-containing putative Zn-dependent protease [Mesobacillus persicus]SEN14998.1 Uncharacterized protein YjaZ [Mesobacillus persicus]
MGIVRTDEWLEQDFHRPVKICEQHLRDSFNGDSPENIYQYLVNFGMYKPNRRTLGTFKWMQKSETWDRLAKVVENYRKEWKGPDVPVYLFPMNSGGIFSNRGERKSGVSFRDKIFLFLSPLDDEGEQEALFVHEYHHVCRMKQQKKRADQYTLLDSIILEGLAENAVFETCGESYRAKWCTYYSSKQLSRIWEQHIKNNLDARKNTSIHDEILFGYKSSAPLMGYAFGYELVERYKHNNKQLTMKDSFRLPSETFIKEID